MDDIRKEVARITGKYVHPSVIGKIAKEKRLYKYQHSIKLYHRSLVKHVIKHVKEYYDV